MRTHKQVNEACMARAGASSHIAESDYIRRNRQALLDRLLYRVDMLIISTPPGSFAVLHPPREPSSPGEEGTFRDLAGVIRCLYE
jgi:hypothetical protein